MANDLNKVILVGRLVRDIECKQVGETNLGKFTLAVGSSYTSNGVKKEETSFIDCETWGKLTEIVQKYEGKGKQVAIEGKLKQDTWEGQDGKKQSKIKIKVDSLQLLGGGKSDNGDNSQSSTPDPDDIF